MWWFWGQEQPLSLADWVVWKIGIPGAGTWQSAVSHTDILSSSLVPIILKKDCTLPAAQLAQWDKRPSAEREVIGSNLGWTNNQGL